MNLLGILKSYGYFKNHKFFYYKFPLEVLIRLFSKKRLLFSEIYFENRCNLRCWHCSSASFMTGRTQSMSLEQIRIVLSKLKSIGVLSAAFVGGEPTLRKDLIEIIQLSNSFMIIPSIITNGINLSEQKIDSLFKVGLGNMGFSLQSMDPETHNRMVNRKGAHSKLIGTIEYCLRKNYTCSICVVPTNENLKNGDFRKMVDFAVARKIRINANLPAPVGKLFENDETMLNDDSMCLLRKEYFPLTFFQPDFKQSLVPGRVYCPMGEYSVYIFPNGEVCPCTFTHVSFGNILTEPIKDILDRMLSSNIMKNIKRQGSCPISMDKEFQKKVLGAIKESNGSYPPKWNELNFE